MIDVFIIDDHPLVVEGIKVLLSDSAIARVSGSALAAADGLAQLKNQAADIVLLDINLPDMDGIEACAQLKSNQPGIKILALSTFKERSFITRMISAGASGYLLKNVSREELEEALIAVYRGKLYLSMEAAEVLTSSSAPSPEIPLLTSREKEVLQLISEGYTNQEIANQLFISPLTVDSHRKNLLTKLGVKNTAMMIRFAVEYKLI